MTLAGGEPYSGPHGVAFYDGTNLSSINGISGLIDSDLGFFLTAVFLDDSSPSGAVPSILDFTGKEDFTDLHPIVAQSLYMGNGYTGTTAQLFVPPARATRLFFGHCRRMRPGERWASGMLPGQRGRFPGERDFAPSHGGCKVEFEGFRYL